LPAADKNSKFYHIALSAKIKMFVVKEQRITKLELRRLYPFAVLFCYRVRFLYVALFGDEEIRVYSILYDYKLTFKNVGVLSFTF